MDATFGDDIMSRKKAEIISDGPTIYIGPSLSKWPLKQYTSFIGGVLPANIAAKVEENPEVKAFIVSPLKISEIERKIADKTSAYALQFAKINKLNEG